eukprot:jgi/Botrbrau1/23285/Bobra.0102s0028.1
MDSMYVPERYNRVYFNSFLYIFTLTLPHSISVNVAFPEKVYIQGNVFGFGSPKWMAARHLFSHADPPGLRVCLLFSSALLPALLVYLVALAFPFYGTLNALGAAIAAPCIAFIFPCLAFNWWFRTKENRDSCKYPPPKWLLPGGSWTPLFIANIIIVLVFLVNGTFLGIYFSVKAFIRDVSTFSVFAKCYQC